MSFDVNEHKIEIRQVAMLGEFTKEEYLQQVPNASEERLTNLFRKGFVNRNSAGVYKATVRLKEMNDMLSEGRFERMVNEVLAFDKEKGYKTTMDIPESLHGTVVFALVINKIAGEIADDVKKLIRDGMSHERLDKITANIDGLSGFLIDNPTTAVIPKEHQNMAYLALALNGEAGEIAEEVYELSALDAGDQDNLKKELVDVAIYLAKAIGTENIDFDKWWEEKHDELRKR